MNELEKISQQIFYHLSFNSSRLNLIESQLQAFIQIQLEISAKSNNMDTDEIITQYRNLQESLFESLHKPHLEYLDNLHKE